MIAAGAKGIDISLDTKLPQNILGGLEYYRIKFTTPTNVTTEKSATLVGSKLHYTTLAGELDIKGMYLLQTHVKDTIFENWGEPFVLIVE